MKTKTKIQFALVVIMYIIILFCIVDWYGVEPSYANEEDYLSPSETITLCEAYYIGYEYDESLSPICSLLWEKFTYDIIQSFNIQ